MKINLLLFALLVTMGQAMNDVNFQANSSVDAAALKQKSSQGELELFGKSISSVDISLKKKPSGKLTSFKTDEKGKADFGVLSAGEYVLTLSTSETKRPDDTPQLAGSFSTTKSNIKNLRVRIEGTASGTLDKVWDVNQISTVNPDEMNATRVNPDSHGIHFEANGKSQVVVTVLTREQQGPAN
jgi:hypothetical protein